MVDTHIVGPFVPVTIGRCLCLTDRRVYKRRIQHIDVMLCPWECEDIMGLLRDGKDVGLCMTYKSQPTRLQEAYAEYFWSRIQTIQSTGYEIIDFLGEKPGS